MNNFTTWLRERGRQPQTIAQYAQTVTMFERHLGGRSPSVETVKSFLTENWGGEQPRLSSYARHLAAIRAYLLFCGVSADGLHSPAIKSKAPSWLTTDEIECLFEACTTPTETALLTLLYWGGLRASEALSLKIKGIDWSESLLTVEAKGGGERVVPVVNAGAMATLKGYVGSEDRALWLRANPGRQDYVLPLRYEHVNKIVQFVAGEAGIAKRVTPHTLRHSIASTFVGQSVPIWDIAQFLGHRSIKSTEIYVHSHPVGLRDRLKDSFKN